MTAEELLKRRVKVKADYPNSELRIGDILEDCQRDYELWENQRDGIKWTINPENYPAIFEPLPWYADRKPEDMPEYVKGLKSVKKLLQMEYHTDEYPSFLLEGGTIWGPAWMYQPATKEEYDNYMMK